MVTFPTHWLLIATVAAAAKAEPLPADGPQQPVCLANPNSATCQGAEQADDERQQQQQQQQQPDDPPCGLFLAESTLHRGLLGIFTGTEFATGAEVGGHDLHVPIFDANQNEWSLWHEIMWNADIEDDLLLQNYYQAQSFTPGTGALLACASDALANVHARRGETVDSLGVHRSKDPTAGSFSYRQRRSFVASTELVAGQELFTNCDNVDMIYDDDEDEEKEEPRRMTRSIEWLKSNGICIDNLDVRPSTIPHAGRGAFAKRFIPEGQTIITSPVVQFDRSQIQIVEQYVETPDDDVKDEGGPRLKYTENVQGHQLLVNYCLGLENSTVLLLPYGPGVNYINHANPNDGRTPNAILDWSELADEYFDEDALDTDAYSLFYRKQKRLIVDYIALRDIQAGEEILIDYGAAWQKAWDQHVATWQAPPDSDTYMSAAEYKAANPLIVQGETVEEVQEVPFRTLEEQQENPYPANIRTACKYEEVGLDEDADNYEEEGPPVYWNKENDGCLRPCTILERKLVGQHYYYTVQVEDIPNELAPEYYLLWHDRQTVLRTPHHAIDFVDIEYTSDQFLSTAFRHEIQVPEDMFPDIWMANDPEPMGDFLLPDDMKVGDIDQIRWKATGEVVTPNAHIMKLRPKVRESLLEYCDKMGITERFRDVTYRGNPYPPGKNGDVVIQGLNWYVQRPPAHWKSNMHWISPLDSYAQDDYLRALSAAGFDEVLQQIGEHFNMKGLACYHVTFIGVSHCQQGYMHYDVTNTGQRVFNVIIPLILANETGPELDLQGANTGLKEGSDVPAGRLRYQYDIASMMGDDAFHGTSAVDYRVKKEMRMAATVYVADIGEDNIDAILADYTQHYPPQDRPDILLGMAGAHWKRDDPTAKLPEPFVGDFETNSLAPYQIASLTWKRTKKAVQGFAHRIGLPTQLREHLLDYCNKVGITERYHALLLEGDEVQAHPNKAQGYVEEMGGMDWYIQRPPQHWKSNMHWISPGNQVTHDDFLKQLSLGGFDGVLESIGNYFQLDGLVAYHLSFMAVSHCVRGYVHHDFSGTDGKAFNIIIPLMIVPSTGPELEVEDDNDQMGGYRYVYDEATIIGDGARHATGRVDYREEDSYRLAVSVYIADVNENNAQEILKDFTQVYPPHNEEGIELLRSWAGRHWKPSGEDVETG